MNYGWKALSGGKYMFRCADRSKTAVRNLYITARGGQRCVEVNGSSNNQGGLDFSDCVFEGQNAGDPAMGALIVHKGGGATYTNIKLNFGMARPSDYTDQADTALIMVTGGVAAFSNLSVNKATATSAAVPVIDVQGGTAYIGQVMALTGYTVGQQLPAKVATAAKLVSDASLKTA